MTPAEEATGGPLAVVALGANLGDPERALRAAARALARLGAVVAASELYRTQPVGGPPGQPLYRNAVMVLAPAPPWRTPERLLRALLALEVAAGRDRRERWGPRVLDLDLISLGAETRAAGELVLPHPRAAERAFVMVPLASCWPGWRDAAGRRADAIVQRLDLRGVEATGRALLPGAPAMLAVG
jgi:2-amino-4-hydroxy-6-hydroxymethyldihydropteridine diphosphokinase